MNTDNHQMHLSNETVFYGPTYQFVIRMLLSALTLFYFFFLPIPLYVFNLYFVYLTFFIYFTFHIIWWIQFRKKGISFNKRRLANWVDLIIAGMTVVVDPYLIPPTIVLILIVVRGNGIQHGLSNFIRVAKNAIPACLIFIPLHFLICRQWPPYDFYFLITLLIICGHYSLFLLKRIESIKEREGRSKKTGGFVSSRVLVYLKKQDEF